MSLLRLDFPPGLSAEGTDLQTEGRWLDCSLVRWQGRVMQPVGGWVERGVTIGTVVRGAMAWRDNDGDQRAAFGSPSALRLMALGGSLTAIEPLDLAPGRTNATGAYGYGIGAYGAFTYGTPRPETTVTLPATTWALDTWGENLIAVSSDDRRILEWTPATVGRATRLPNSPLCSAAVVTDERFVFALAADGDPRKVAWSGRENNTLWAPSATNEAGDIMLQTRGVIVAGCRANGSTLILTNRDAHAATYIGPPYVYRFERVGSACGLIAPLAVTQVAQGAVWMGERGFYLFSGGAVQEIPCAIADRIFTDLNRAQASKIAATTNERWSEVWWFYPSAGSIECDSYVAWNFRDNLWYRGQLARTAGIDAGTFKNPLMVGPDGKVYDHETGYQYGGTRPWAESAPITQGGRVFTATGMIPDERTRGEVTATFKTRLYPNGDEAEHGPYQMGLPTSMRFTGREMRLRVDGVANADWRVGVQNVDIQPRGMR